MKTGEKLYDEAIKGEEYDQDLMYDAIDSFNRASKLSFEIDTEVEAKCQFWLGKIFYKGF